jgi:hypothetical protein
MQLLSPSIAGCCLGRAVIPPDVQLAAEANFRFAVLEMATGVASGSVRCFQHC